MAGNWEYVVVWSLYVLAGFGLTFIVWRLTRSMGQIVLQQILRGTLVVMIFTPWYAGPSTTHFAPATLVLLFDLFFVDKAVEYGSGYALLASFCLMLVILGMLQLRKK